MTSFKYKLRTTLINVTGYFICRKSGLPVGVDLQEDLLNKFDINPRIIFDAGANIGQTAIHYAELFPKAEIFSFEPFYGAFRSLELNTNQLERVKRFQIALGKSAAEVDVRIYNDDYSHLNSLRLVNENQSGSAPVERIRVGTLDEFCRSNGVNEIDLLKIDTEGYELEVLKGGEELLRRGTIRAILCEVALARQNQWHTQLVDLQDYLEQFGYFFVGLYDSNLNYYSDGNAYSNGLFLLASQTTNYFAALRFNGPKSAR